MGDLDVTGEFDVADARAQTPGTEYVVHLNNAGAALPPAVVTDTVVDHLRLEATIGGYEAAAVAAARLSAVYASIARLIGCRPADVALTESATRAWDMAFYGLRLGASDVILTGEAEYSSNVIAFLQRARRTGVGIEVVGSDAAGQVDVDLLRQRVRDLAGRVALVALTHVPTSGGLVNPAATVGEIARTAGVPYLLDACQSVGQLDIDVDVLGCDMLTATGRKFLRAPRGTGFLYVAPAMLDRLEPPFLDLHAARWVAEDRYEMRDDARRFESWEADLAARLGLGAAVDHALGWGLPAIEARVRHLAVVLRDRLRALPGVAVHDRGRDQCGIVTFSVVGAAATDVVARLRAERINTSSSPASSAHLDLGRRGLPDLVRASVHYYNTEDELAALTDAVRAGGFPGRRG